MHPLLAHQERVPDTRPLATDVLNAWLEARGFSLNQRDPNAWSGYSGGYFTKGIGNSSRWRDYDAHTHGGIAYRGGDHNNVRAQLREVVEVLEKLGVTYDVEVNEYGYPWLIVPISDALDGVLGEPTPIVVLPTAE